MSTSRISIHVVRQRRRTTEKLYPNWNSHAHPCWTSGHWAHMIYTLSEQITVAHDTNRTNTYNVSRIWSDRIELTVAWSLARLAHNAHISVRLNVHFLHHTITHFAFITMTEDRHSITPTEALKCEESNTPSRRHTTCRIILSLPRTFYYSAWINEVKIVTPLPMQLPQSPARPTHTHPRTHSC